MTTVVQRHDARADGSHDALTLRALSVMRDGREIVHAVDLDLPARGVLAVLGRNGAGRSTLLEGIAGQLVRRGQVLVGGIDVSDGSALTMARSGVVLAQQGGGTFPGLRVAEHLSLAGRGVAAHDVTLFEESGGAVLTPKIARLCTERADQVAETLSGGERRLLALALVALRAPRVALLDEPSEGVAPIVLPELVAAVRVLAERCAVVLVEQRLDVVRALADTAVVLDRGIVIASGPLNTLSGDGVLSEVLGP